MSSYVRIECDSNYYSDTYITKIECFNLANTAKNTYNCIHDKYYHLKYLFKHFLIIKLSTPKQY